MITAWECCTSYGCSSKCTVYWRAVLLLKSTSNHLGVKNKMKKDIDVDKVNDH